MNTTIRSLVAFSLLLLLTTVVAGVIASWAFLYPENFNTAIPFQQLRPIHVSAALFWIITGAVSCLLYYSQETKKLYPAGQKAIGIYAALWITTILVIFFFYSIKQFGGREYWEFPPWLSIPILISWLLLMAGYFTYWVKIKDKKSLYWIMWATGILFFCITFIEQNLWQINWFRQSYLREVTVQWKANGSMVGAWNQMIYGSSLYLMAKISGDESIAQNRTVRFFYFLSLTNLMFNWGHHIYNVPTAGWVRHVSYLISMTEWLFFISMIRSFKSKLEESRRLKHLLTYRFIIASELWLFLNLILALMMSIPAINRYTHGTHITVAHAMGTTIGINTMILLGAIGYMLKVEELDKKHKRTITLGFYITQLSLLVFWICLVVAGIEKAYRTEIMPAASFQEIMRPVITVLKVFSLSGISLLTGISTIAVTYLSSLKRIRIL
ncbi:MAG: cytochrome C oxidase subunit I [Bacteroidetes bacterium 43-93]|nr:cbb3-type cytochrome c oxidase subunit I [Bacteroidota bacterium]OJW97730.1 MAG: cytochrome C oxidase subunit I [Bacteroidetes bacterium 43-93]